MLNNTANGNFVVNATEMPERAWAAPRYLALLVALASQRNIILLTTNEQHRAIQNEVSEVTENFDSEAASQMPAAVGPPSTLRTATPIVERQKPIPRKKKKTPAESSAMTDKIWSEVAPSSSVPEPPRDKTPATKEPSPRKTPPIDSAITETDDTFPLLGQEDDDGDDDGDEDALPNQTFRIFTKTFELGQGAECKKLKGVQEADSTIKVLVLNEIDFDESAPPHREHPSDVYLMCDDNTRMVSADTKSGIVHEDAEIQAAINTAKQENASVYVLCVS
jgi:hypothetical protein